MKILVVGGGGREHALIKKLKENPQVDVIYALPGNAGMAEAECVPIGAKELDRIVAFARENKIEFAVVAPDDPLVMGLVDLLNEKMTATPLYPMIHLKGDDIEVVITHNDQYGEEFYSFVNGQHTLSLIHISEPTRH